jgi:hypothetical protein
VPLGKQPTAACRQQLAGSSSVCVCVCVCCGWWCCRPSFVQYAISASPLELCARFLSRMTPNGVFQAHMHASGILVDCSLTSLLPLQLQAGQQPTASHGRAPRFRPLLSRTHTTRQPVTAAATTFRRAGSAWQYQQQGCRCCWPQHPAGRPWQPQPAQGSSAAAGRG